MGQLHSTYVQPMGRQLDSTAVQPMYQLDATAVQPPHHEPALVRREPELGQHGRAHLRRHGQHQHHQHHDVVGLRRHLRLGHLQEVVEGGAGACVDNVSEQGVGDDSWEERERE
jgi:hypothetical protein